MTNQEILERNIEWFIYRKNPKAKRLVGAGKINVQPHCAYFSDGKQCGVGCLMTPDKALELEAYCSRKGRTGISVHDVFYKFTELMGGEISLDQKDFLEKIQGAHDDAADGDVSFRSCLLKTWKELVVCEGQRFKITMPTIYEVT